MKPGPKPQLLIKRFLRYVEAPAHLDDCIPWLGSATAHGYGSFNGTTAHRAAYLLFVGDLPEDSHRVTVDHLCRTILCVNTFHLEAVPQVENARRGKGSWTHCVNGHEFTPENTIHEPRGAGTTVTRRRCRACKNERQRKGRSGSILYPKAGT